MKECARRLVIVAVALLVISPAFASTLESKKHELAFDFAYTDTDSVGKDISLDLGWGWIFSKGYHQVGALVSYFSFDFDDPLAPDIDGVAIGPLYTFNWTPANDKGTGFAEAAYLITSGDLGDVVDSVVHVAVGAKMFAGDSAAIRVSAFYEKNKGVTGFPDQDATGLSAGISIFLGKGK
jgi:hypothetical protein